MSSTTQNYLAFDMGAESGRAVLGRFNGRSLDIEVLHRYPNRMVQFPTGWHWNTPGLWAEIKTGLAMAARQAPLHSIGLDTWGVDFGLIDSAGGLLGLPYAYREARFLAAKKEVLDRFGSLRLYNQTGIQELPFNTIFQLYALQKFQPHLLEVAQRLLFTPDLYGYFFTGQMTCELSIASTSGLIDPRTRDWRWDVIRELGLPERLFISPVASGTPIGTLSERVRSECGCDAFPVTATCGHDTAAAVAAVPASGNDWCYISSGTWSLMGVELEQPVLTEAALKAGFTNELGVGGRVRFLRNIMGLWPLQECKRRWEEQGHKVGYAELAEEAGKVTTPVAVLDPDHPAFLPAGDMPGRIIKYAQATGQPVPSSLAEFTRALVQALALRYRFVLEKLEGLIGKRIEVIHIVGGGGQNTLLNQMTADCCRREVLVGPTEATAIGNLLVQALGCGELKGPDDVREVVRVGTRPIRYEPKDPGLWDGLYEKFLALQATPPSVG